MKCEFRVALYYGTKDICHPRKVSYRGSPETLSVAQTGGVRETEHTLRPHHAARPGTSYHTPDTGTQDRVDPRSQPADAGTRQRGYGARLSVTRQARTDDTPMHRWQEETQA
eukprot:2287256-Prymnesium_polylepis.2